MLDKFCWSDPSEDPFEFLIDKLVELTPAAATLPDFSRILVVVSGRQWVRNLKFALIERFPQGVCPPKILTPGTVLRYGTADLRCATDGEQLAVWEEVLKSQKDNTEFRSVFPRRDNVYSDAVFRNLAKGFFSLRQELVQNGKTIAEAEKVLAAQDERWHALAALESAFTAKLNDLQLMDPAEANRHYVSQDAAAALSKDFSHIVIAFVPDMPELLERKLQRVEERVTLLIHGDERDAKNFDAWGRPTKEWSEVKLEFAKEHLHCVTDPEQAALLTLALATKDGSQPLDPAKNAIVLGKPEFFPAFESVFQRICYDGTAKPVTLFSPEDVSGSRLRIAGFLQKLNGLLQDEEKFSAFNALLRDSAFSGYLRSGTGISGNRFLGDLDQFVLDALPDNVTSAIALLDQRIQRMTKALEEGQKVPHAQGKLATWNALKTLFIKGQSAVSNLNHAPDFCTELKKLLKTVFSQPGYPPTLGVSFDDEVNFWQKAIKQLQNSPIQRLLPNAEQKLRYLLQECEKEPFHPGRDDDAILIYNFLEYPALTQPEPVLIGMNWGIVPAVPGITPYLTDSIRQTLALKNSESLAALEAYKLFMLLKRKPDTRLLVLKVDETNAPLRPAGMLFAGCEEAELLERATCCREAKIVKDVAAATTRECSHFGLNLKNVVQQPFFQKNPLEFSVTEFETYLSSPLMFLLQKVCGIDCPDYANGELEASAFGTACHKGFEQLPLDQAPDAPPCVSEDDYYQILEQGTDAYLEEQYGKNLPLLVELQQDQIHLRLKAAAKYLAQEHGKYRLLESEYSLNSGQGIMFGGALIKGKIDRIELSSDGKTLRLIDIKTYNTADKHTPEEKHLKGRSEKTLINLQLPLYYRLLMLDDGFWATHHLNPYVMNFEAGYLLLTADSDVAELKLWKNDFLTWCEKTEEEVKKIVAELQNFSEGEKLPPEPKSAEYYDLSPLFVPNVQEAFFMEKL